MLLYGAVKRQFLLNLFDGLCEFFVYVFVVLGDAICQFHAGFERFAWAVVPFVDFGFLGDGKAAATA